MTKTKKNQKNKAKNQKKNINKTKKSAPTTKVAPKKTKQVEQKPKTLTRKTQPKTTQKEKKAPKVTNTRQIRKKAAPPKPKMAYTESQYDQYKKLIEKYDQKYGVNQLKEILKKNDQTTTGAKDDLLKKIADGEVLGRIPRCSSCFGGRLRFDFKTGVYNCPGYRDDTDFHNCHKKYQFSEITRLPWTS